MFMRIVEGMRLVTLMMKDKDDPIRFHHDSWSIYDDHKNQVCITGRSNHHLHQMVNSLAAARADCSRSAHFLRYARASIALITVTQSCFSKQLISCFFSIPLIYLLTSDLTSTPRSHQRQFPDIYPTLWWTHDSSVAGLVTRTWDKRSFKRLPRVVAKKCELKC